MRADPPTTVPALLAARAEDEPDRVALVLDGVGTLTFGQWRTRADAGAHELRARGVRRGDRIGLVFGGADWLDFAVAYCAVTTAGAVAVPLSDRTPAAADLLTRCGATGVLHAGAAPDGPWWSVHADDLGRASPGPAGDSACPDDVRPGDLAQIVHTSGTTGQPKGVAATHANLTFGATPRPRRRPLAHSRHFVHAFPIGTNAAQTMLVQALTARPAAVVAPRFDTDGFAALIARHRAGTVFVVPSMAIDLLRARAPERYDLTGVLLVASTGAALPPAVARDLAAALPDATVVNNYTSTEAAPAHTTVVYDPDRPTALGRPATGAALRITDQDGVPLPPGATGEVWLRADTLPRTYFGDPAASAAVFHDGWVRMGDLGRLDADGYLHLVDRDGDTVKTGGFKVSTLHVESVLFDHPDVADAAVVGLPHATLGAMVAAAVVPRRPVTADALRAHLADRLAPHERPLRLLLVDTLPRNDGGKVVRAALRDLFARRPEPLSAGRPDDVDGAPTAAERTLAALWGRVLGVPAPDRHDDFFALGGDSLKAAQIATLAAAEFGVAVPASVVFDRPVLAAQAGWLATATAAPQPAGPDGPAAAPTPYAAGPDPDAAGPDPAGPGGRQVPLTAQQENFLAWMYATDEPRDPGPISVAIRITDDLDPALLEAALCVLVDRHEALRTVFPAPDGTPRGHLLAACPPAVTVTAATDEAHAAQLVRADRELRFGLDRGPLVRAIVVRLGEADHVLGLAVHHLVFDGWSMGVLLRELGLVYSALRTGRPPALPALPVPHADAVRWTRAQWPRTRRYWLDRLDGAPAVVEPFPGRRHAVRLHSDSLEFRLDPAAAGSLRALATDRGATTFMLVTAAWAAVLTGWSGVPDLVVMSPVPGRGRPEFETLVGCLVQSLPLRIDTAGDPTFTELLDRVRATALAAVDHQYYPFAEFYARFPAAAWLRFESWGGDPHFPGLLSQGFPLPRALDADWPTPDGQPDLGVPELAMVEQPDGSVSGWLLWNSYAFDRSTPRRLAAGLLRLLHALPAGATTPVSELVGRDRPAGEEQPGERFPETEVV
ncbi:condensation domain-containing protein [Polymorphospora rubra]|uniref:condensation domain-containing protein n=1 Tax=Polymorphospora rubra TaxID=338584 RepID=UPI0033EFB008